MLANEPTEPIDAMEPALPILAIEPKEPTDRMEPALPMLPIEPAEPTDAMEPALPMLAMEPAPPSDHNDPGDRDDVTLVPSIAGRSIGTEQYPIARTDREG